MYDYATNVIERAPESIILFDGCRANFFEERADWTLFIP